MHCLRGRLCPGPNTTEWYSRARWYYAELPIAGTSDDSCQWPKELLCKIHVGEGGYRGILMVLKVSRLCQSKNCQHQQAASYIRSTGKKGTGRERLVEIMSALRDSESNRSSPAMDFKRRRHKALTCYFGRAADPDRS